jgi:hypothetical protein
MKRAIAIWVLLLTLACLGTALAQFGGGQTGIPGAGPQIGSPGGPQVPGQGPMIPPTSGGGYVPPAGCTGTIDFSTGCAQPMIGGL